MLTEDQLKNLKNNVVTHLLTFSKNKWLSSRYFFENLIERVDFSSPEGRKRLEHFQRVLASTIAEIMNDQYIYKEFCVVSSDKGYKIATTNEDYEKGITYLFEKIDEPLKRIKFIESMQKKHLKIKPETGDFFIKEVSNELKMDRS
jgi:hypothetical protein